MKSLKTNNLHVVLTLVFKNFIILLLEGNFTFYIIKDVIHNRSILL
jgi:hypothetical protein